MEITLPSGRKIGDGHKPFIIAEIGSNWATLDDCLMSIRAAKNCGADAVKFQAYSHGSLYGLPDPKPVSHESPAHLKTVTNYSLPLEWLPKLKRECDEVGIEFMCSAFSPELVEAVDPFVNIHKVASAEMTHIRILEKLRDLGKPVFLSTGASGGEDISIASNLLGNTPLVLMYCIAAYPAKMVHLGGIGWLKENFWTLAGYSDHSLDALMIPSIAIKQGACVLEKHVTFIDRETPDSPHSLNEREFKAMVKQIKGEGYAPGPGATAEEQDMVLMHNRRLIATKPIEAGQIFKEGENFGIYRSTKKDTKALSPWAVNEVNGKKAKVNLSAGEGIGPGDIE